MLYIAYLDEFGHDGQFLARTDPRHNHSPIFGLGGFVLPYTSVRPFGSWFYELKKKLLAWEIAQAGEHPAKWEKKGSSLFTTRNVEKYPELRRATFRILNKIKAEGGFCFFNGIEKYDSRKGHDSHALYKVSFTNALRRLDDELCHLHSHFLVIIDEHEGRTALVEAAARTMFGDDRAKMLIEAPIEVESHLYQNVQCADWICGLIGRLGCYRIRPDEYPDLLWAEKYFGERIDALARRSSIRRKRADNASGTVTTMALAFNKALSEG